jgi:hypothetical protein
MLGYWPESAVHQRATLANPRFQDFEYVSFYGGNSGDRSEGEDALLAWMSNGMILATERDESTTGYLDIVDIPPLPCDALLSDSLIPSKLVVNQ